MKKVSFKAPVLTLNLFAAALLSACAGGSVPIPDQVKSVPTAHAITLPNPDVFEQNPDGDVISHHSSGGKLERYKANVTGNGITFPDNVFFYRAADGRLYKFSEFTNPFIPGSFSPVQDLPSKQSGQPTDNGGRLVACCSTKTSRTEGPLHVRNVAWGVWVSSSGQADMFYGGIPANVADMQGAAAAADKLPTGKASYEVLAFRTRGGSIVASTHNNAPGSPNRSILTVNFNTKKLGGKILGNNDFGADIDFNDVNVNGNSFSGSVSSGGVAGQVNGNFYGKPSGWSSPGGSEIGGKVNFAGKSELNSVFGGRSYRNNENDTSTDLTPLP